MFEHRGAPAALGLIFSMLFMGACAPARQPVPLGTIPAPRPVTVQEEQYGHQILQQLSQRWKLDYDDPRLPTIINVVDRLSTAAKAGREPWHVYLFKDSKFKNAAATRGNHVFVWSGLLEKTKSEAELAAVIGHEMAHVLARHTDPDPNEEIKKILINVGALAAGIAVSSAANANIAQTLGNMTSSVTNEIGSGLLVYPYSREMELEADQVGLMLMAEAKYDPKSAMDFWSRAGRDPDFARGLQFFSTHPPTEQRLENIERALPLALAKYRGERQMPALTPSGSSNGDTFDISTTGKSASVGDDKERWTVAAPRAVLYSEPSTSSATIGEFSRGAPVSGSSQSGWVEIYAPDHGFIRLSDLTPENRSSSQNQ